MRKHWIDNLRWVTVLLVLFYHVIYYYNGKGVVGGIGGFGGPQYQDFVMYLLYPWFMPLLFLLAGISARYALDAHSEKEWFKSRTRKLLVPATIGLFVFQWIAGYFNTGGCTRSVLRVLREDGFGRNYPVGRIVLVRYPNADHEPSSRKFGWSL